MKQETKQILLYLAIFIVAYYLLIRPILTALGLVKSQERKETERRKQDQLETEIKNVSQSQKSTKSVQEWQVIADQIYEDLRYSAVSDNKADAGYQVSRVQNDADFWELYRLFGKRREYLFGIPSGSLQDLSQFIRSNLSDSQIETINNNYKRKGIKFRF